MSEEPSFFWYDYETSGRDYAKDRVMQFGGLRTDAELNPIGEPMMLYCKLSLDTLPEPGACLIHGLSPQRVARDGMSEPEFAARIHAEFAKPGTCACGYNNIGFDDHFTRHMLFRNFYDPYRHEWERGNSRWDLLDVMRMWHATRPEGLQWPVDENGGHPSFKLEMLARANDIALDAHDALSDVKATVELARRLRAAQPKLFDYAFNLRSRREAARRLLPMLGVEPILHVSKFHGNARGCVAALLPLWADDVEPRRARLVLGLDLGFEPDECLRWIEEGASKGDEGAGEDGEGMRADAQTRKSPLAMLRLNRCPMFVKARGMLDEDLAHRVNLDLEGFERNLRLHLERAEEMRAALARWHQAHALPEAQAVDCENLYAGGLIGDADLARFAEVRAAPRADLDVERWSSAGARRFSELLFRYRARHWTESLSESQRERWEEYRYRRLTDPEAGASITLDDYLEQLGQMRSNSDFDKHAPLLRELEEWADIVSA